MSINNIQVSCTNDAYVGYLLPHIVKVLKVGGRNVETVLRERLQQDCPELLEHVDLEAFKRRYCYVKQANDAEAKKRPVIVNGKTYSLNSTVLTDPCEVLFHPEDFKQAGSSLVEQIQSAFNSMAAEDKELMKVTSTIVLSGGPTLHEGFVTRLEQELKEMLAQQEFKLIALRSRQVDAWVGGSILGSLSTFPSMWITRAEYDESGKYFKSVVFSTSFDTFDRSSNSSQKMLLIQSFALEINGDYILHHLQYIEFGKQLRLSAEALQRQLVFVVWC